MGSYIDKQELNRWISELENQEQLNALRSMIFSAKDHVGLWRELSKSALQKIGHDTGVPKTDIHLTNKRFWEVVCSMRESSKPWSWDELPEEVKAGIQRGKEDIATGRYYSNKKVWKEIEEKFGYKSRFLDE
ncbi:hypothetical protein SAMN05443144_13037 [Fodinibius roseus]|uniref:Uncharacterized protein n=1 Tax=Fodinibius roseus TaxID=1194090 RepID=A0A1M5KAA5_9BACT|nr:hypothetical protein [Fodinibius roseus]SHG49786.1 hypothetical protein SAMN05443144_13037 [Fodinibius roseus]